MALIRIERNEAGNCINFHGATNPSYWNTCLHAEVDSVDTDRINIVNDIRTTDNANPVYEFYKIPYTEFVDADGSAFSTAAECADYITTNANVLGGSGGKLFDPNDRIGFSRDFTDTTILITNGDAFGVNSIQAVSDGEGTITIQEHGRSSDISKIYREVNHSHVSINGSLVGGTLENVVNQLNALFTVSPLGAGGQQGPTIFQVSSTANITVSSIGTEDPSGTPILEDDGLVGHGVVASTEFISEKGEYFQFTMTGRGRFLFGLYENGVDSIVSGTNLQTNKLWAQGMYDHGDYVAPDAAYGRDNSTSQEDGWAGASGVQFRYNTNLQADLSSGNPVAFRVGITSEGYIASYYYDDGRSNNWVMIGRSSYYAGDGDYGLHITLVGQGAQVYATPTISHVDTTLEEVTVYYIESPDGSFHFPLYETETQADAADIVAGGSGSSTATVYVDEPTFTTWYIPVSGSFTDFSAAPTSTSAVSYTEIPTNADNLYAPAALTLPDHIAAENTSVNIQIIPQDVVATVTGLPTGLSYSNGYIQGTTPYVIRDTEHVITVERSNAYGTTSQTFTLTITDNASLSNLADVTEVQGNFVQPNRIITTHDALVEYDVELSSGWEMTYSYGEGQLPPTIGILSDVGASAVSAFDSNTQALGGASAYDFGLASMWDLRYVTGNNWIGGGESQSSLALTGWNDNTTIVGTGDVNLDAEFKLEYDSSGYINLYRDGALMLSSANTFSGPQTLHFAAFDDQIQTDVYIPTNLTITQIGAGSTTPPTGFEDPLLVGEMANATLMGDTNGEDAAAEFTDTLDVNHRYIFPQAWVEANILPYASEGPDEVLFGVPEVGASFTDVGTGDFDIGVRLEGRSSASHYSKLMKEGAVDGSVLVNSDTDAFYDYALEWDGTDLHVIACNIGDINTQPAVSRGGVFSRVTTISGYSARTGSLPIVIGVDGGAQVNLSTAGLQKIRIPFGARDILVGEESNGNGNFSTAQPAGSLFDVNNGGHAPSTFTYAAPTLNAGYTYRFVYHASMESGDFLEFRRADDNTVYTSGVTTFGSGDPTFSGTYKGVEFAVPADAPPLRAYFYNSFSSSYDAGRELPISGSTYVVDVSGITLEGPAANQTGNNLFDSGDHGWASIDEQLGAGERLVMSTAFLADLVDAMPDGTSIKIGLKDTGWVSTTADTNFEGNLRFVIERNSSTDVDFRTWSGATSTTLINSTVAGITSNNIAAVLDLTNTGNNIRFGIRSDATNNSDSASSTAYADWNSSYKVQTGDQGFGLSSVDIMVFGRDGTASAAMDTADVDWTGLSEISIPQPAATLTTPWTKALDFAGGGERALQATNSNSTNPLRMGGVNTTVAAPGTAGNTSSDSNARPWATAIVFKYDGNRSNQHIWNHGEGAGSTDDNIYLRLDAAGNIYFGWGRSGALNECRIAYLGTSTNTNHWHGIYIAHTGERLSGSNATAANLADCFDIRWFTTNFTGGVFGSWMDNKSTSANWTAGSTGGRMDRAFVGDFTVGGRGSNRNYHGKVASMVVTTLKQGQAMPTDAEITKMVKDPQQWQIDYKNGQDFRASNQATTTSNFTGTSHDGHTQIWLMGDGANDAYAQIRNNVNPSAQSGTSLNMVSMVSNDIETVTIAGLT